jgi:hypothetical protein
MNHGGKRAGAGRPADPNAKQPISARVAPDVRQFLANQQNASIAIESAIRRSKAFKDWKKREKA